MARAFAGLLLALLGLPASAPAQAIRYSYDDLNRLVAMEDRAGNAAFYVWDPVGNLLRVFRGTFPNPESPVGLARFSPTRGAPGTAVTVYGKGFSPVPAENRVTVGGTPALVTAASEVQITFVVPGGVTSGLTVVTSPAGSATSAEPFTVPGGVITTVAGTGAAGFNGDGQPATNAQLNQPNGVALYAAENLYIADRGNHRIRRVDSVTGVITTVAGDGTAGSGGDGGLATSAQLRFPRSVALDAADNLFIADFGDHRIRKVDAATGVITTMAGDGTPGFGGDGGPATGAQLNLPFGIALDLTGNLYIADQFNHRIRRVDAVTGVITTVAGSGPTGIGAGGFGGDGGPGVSALLRFPLGVITDAAGSLFIADTDNHRIRKVSAP